MAKDESFSALCQIIAQGLAYANGGPKNPQNKAVLDHLFDSRYHARSRPRDAFRDAYGLKDEGVPYAAPENPSCEAYGGASIAWFPCGDGTLMTLVVGTKGLAPDEELLTRHGHRRRVSVSAQLPCSTRRRVLVESGSGGNLDHRADVHQILGYAALFDASEIAATLAYPLRRSTWEGLRERGLDRAVADLFGGERHVRVELWGLPFYGGASWRTW